MPVFDCEGDGLTPTKFHVLSYQDGSEIKSLTNHRDMKDWLLSQKVLIGHNISLWDIPQLERVLNVEIKAKLIDTLPLSWYLFHYHTVHGLDQWGTRLGVEKPKIDDWENLSIEEYTHRCETDVEINSLLWDRMVVYLSSLYDVPRDSVPNLPIIEYLSFKMGCIALQEKSGWKVDTERAKINRDKLQSLRDKKIEILKGVMPSVPVVVKKTRPKRPFNKNGTPSAVGQRWFNLLSERGLTKDHTDPIYVEKGLKDPNPASPQQIKDWLFSLGWEPRTFKYEKNDDGTERSIPQVKKLRDPELCDSVLELADKEPAILELQEFTIIGHRLSTFLNRFAEEGVRFHADVGGLTNTLRFAHKAPFANIPGVDKLYGREVRECLIAEDGYELMGVDMVSLEDNTKQHYIWDYDPEYVKEMQKPGFDPHLDLAVSNGALSYEQMEAHKTGTENHGAVRKLWKGGNYGCTYGAYPKRLVRELKIPMSVAKQLFDGFWKRNWAIKEVAANQKIKNIKGNLWVMCPLNGFWLSLRDEKDIFSTINQHTGAYCFDTWLGEVLSRRRQLTAQFHDEGVWMIKKGNRDKATKLMEDSIKAANEKLNLNVELKIDIKFGDRYSEIH